MAERYERAWPIPGEWEGEAVLVQMGQGTDGYWWVLCPATATLHTDDVEGGEDACSYGAECDFPEIHEAAVEVWKAVRDQLTPDPCLAQASQEVTSDR